MAPPVARSEANRAPSRRAWIADLGAGLVVGAVTVLLAVSLGALIFGARLPSEIGTGIGMALATAFLLGAVVAAFSSWPATIAIPQDRIAPILALLVAFVLDAMPSAASPRAQSATAIAAIVVATIVTGLCLSLLGALRLGRWIRFIPYPVVGGFLAGTGWLLVSGSLRVLLGGPPTLAALVEPGGLARWIPGVVLGVTLLVAMRVAKRSFVLPGVLATAIALFYLALALSGTSVAAARSNGWLLESFTSPAPWSGALSGSWSEIHWAVIAGQSLTLATIVLLGATSILLNASALELATGDEIDLNRELQAAGGANLLSGLAGGLVGFQSLGLTSLALRLGGRSRLVGFVAAASAGLALAGGSAILSFVPNLVLGGLLLYLGLTFLADWLWDGWSRLTRADYAVTALIVAVVGIFGYLQGVGVGIGAAAILFAVNYSRINIVKYALSGAHHQSNVDRPFRHHRLLREKGDQIFILKLHGFIFFGTASNLLIRIRERVEDRALPPLSYVVLDFRQVTGLDSSAVLNFVRLARVAEQERFTLVLTHLSELLRRQLRREGLDPAVVARLEEFADLDHGLEWCENEVLAATDSGEEIREVSLREQMAAVLPRGVDVDRVIRHLERREVESGAHLIRQGAPSAELYFIDSGQVTVRLELPEGHSLRLRTMGAGTVVGEMGLYLGQPRSASVIAEERCVVYRLNLRALIEMEDDDPKSAAAFHHFMAHLLAERLSTTNQTLRAVLD